MAKHICFIELMPVPSTIGGVITHLLELSKELIKKGYKISIISPKSPTKIRISKDYSPIHFIHVGLKHKKIEDYRGMRKLYYLIWRFFYELSFVIGVLKKLKEINPDIVHTQSLITTSLPASLSGREFYATSHGIHSKGFTRLYNLKKDFFVSKIASKIYNLIEKFNAKRTKKIICLGKETYDYYSRFNKCTIIANGVDIEKFKPGRKQRNLIISVGRFTKQKQVSNLILAMDFLQDYELLVIGFGPLEEEIKNLCKKRKNCKFLGYKNQEEIPKFLSKATFIVLPSEFEGLPIAMLEAMSSSCIPIATKVGDIPDIIKEGVNGFMLKDNHPKTIAEKIKSIKKDNLKKIARETRRTIKERYSWDKISDKYIEVYNE